MRIISNRPDNGALIQENMKLTKKQSAVLLTKKGALKKEFQKIDWDTKMYPNSWQRGGGYNTLKSTAPATRAMLDVLGLKFQQGNDAERGGLAGDFIKISSRALKKCKAVEKFYKNG